MRADTPHDGPPEYGDAHPATALNETVHQRTRLGILALLVESGRADFLYIKTALELQTATEVVTSRSSRPKGS